MLLVTPAEDTMHSPATIHGDRRNHLVMVRRHDSGDTATKTELKERDRSAHSEWLDWVGARTGLSDTALASAAGQSPNTITRFRRRDGATLSTLTIRLISEFTGLPGPDSYKLPSAGGFAEEAVRYQPAREDDPLVAKLVSLALKDRNNAASWRLRTRALELRGYLPGDVLVSDAAAVARAGDAVVAQVYDLRTGSAETVFRVLEPPYLMPASSDPGFRKPLLIDNERVIVMGVITQAFRSNGH